MVCENCGHECHCHEGECKECYNDVCQNCNCQESKRNPKDEIPASMLNGL